MKTILGCIGLAAFIFGSWPLVARTAGKTGSTGAFIMTVMTIVPAGLMMLRDGVNVPANFACWRLTIAGLMMGTGLLVYNHVLGSPLIEMSVTVPTIAALVIIVSALGSICFFAEQLTVQKVVGITLIVAGVILLRPQAQKLPAAAGANFSQRSNAHE